MKALSASWESGEAGRLRPASAILDELRRTAVSLPVRVTRETETQIREIDSWWRETSSRARLVLSELTESFDLIAGAPQIGRLYRKSPVRNARRFAA